MKERLPSFEELILDNCEGDAIDCFEEEEEEVIEPTEDDYVVFADSEICHEGKCIAKIKGGWDNVERFIRNHARKHGFYPNVWQVSDHGNYHLVTNFKY